MYCVCPFLCVCVRKRGRGMHETESKLNVTALSCVTETGSPDQLMLPSEFYGYGNLLLPSQLAKLVNEKFWGVFQVGGSTNSESNPEL